jgi:hypothetical protein
MVGIMKHLILKRMKNKSIIILLCAVTLLFSSCKKELSTEGVSKTTTYAILVRKGDVAMTILKGGTFTDPGVNATIGNQDVASKVTIEGSVDVNTPGVYTLIYTVVNDDGFPASISRLVGVVDPAVVAIDISGTYHRFQAGAPVMNKVAEVTKTTYPGLYLNNNPGGLPDSDGSTIVYMFHTEPGVVNAPQQPTAEGVFECTDGSYDAANSSFSWICINANYGTAMRTFVKQ